MYLSWYHYKRQHEFVRSPATPLPILNNLLSFLPYLNKSENKNAFVKWGDACGCGPSFNKTVVIFPTYEPVLIIDDLNVVEAIYTTHNALFDKHPLI